MDVGDEGSLEQAITEQEPPSLTSVLTGDKSQDLEQLMNNPDLKTYIASLMGMYNNKQRILKRQQSQGV
jgi:hypothetical protein